MRSNGSNLVLASLALLLAACTTLAPTPPPNFQLSDQRATNFAELALSCVTREYPNKISHVMLDDTAAQTPRQLHPAFYGCFDWHSSVHGHWLLVRLLRLSPQLEFAAAAKDALNANLTPQNIAREVAYITAEGRTSYERPYGIAWILQLAAELREWDDPLAEKWLAALAPLEQAAADKFANWIPKLSYPVRVGTHHSSAFAFSLALDWSQTAAAPKLQNLIRRATISHFLEDINCPISYEPSGEDFLSPCLMEADLMRRVLSQEQFSLWLSGFLPNIPTDGREDWLTPGVVLDTTDGKLVHLDGVNLSRAWNLEMIGLALPINDRRRNALFAAAISHREASLLGLSGEHYSGGHWLGSFATYLTTGRGLQSVAAPELN
ncbi:MAG: hypothetical protein COA47_17200 [Robiginitomaculum sp.]|nr:MAG: hypothetical protein COA47_17200 [Robiginitomaculum sp.]